MRRLPYLMLGATWGALGMFLFLAWFLEPRRHDLFPPGEEAEHIAFITVIIGLPLGALLGGLLSYLLVLWKDRSSLSR